MRCKRCSMTNTAINVSYATWQCKYCGCRNTTTKMHNIRYELRLADGRLVFEDGTSPQNAMRRYRNAFPQAPAILSAETASLQKWFGY